MIDLELTGKVVVVTGASAGIGRATAELLADQGAHVVAAARGTIPDRPGLDSVQVDLVAIDGPTRLVERALELHGRLDGLVNNVGGVTARDGFLAIDDAAWAATLDLNLMTAVRTSRAALPVLAEDGGGSIVHVASEAARLPDPAILDYSAAKAALLVVSRGIALEMGARGVRSNVVSPGPTRTRLWDEPGGFADQLAAQFGMEREAAVEHFVRDVRGLVTGRPGTAAEVARVIAFLLSPLSAQVTGADWAIDGGVH